MLAASSLDPTDDPSARPSDDVADVSLAELDVLRDAVRRTRSGELGGLFERLTAEVGRPEASRLWLQVFSESDASET